MCGFRFSTKEILTEDYNALISCKKIMSPEFVEDYAKAKEYIKLASKCLKKLEKVEESENETYR